MLQSNANSVAAPPLPRADRRPVLLALVFAAAIVPLLLTPLLPFIDLYNHLARYFVLATVDHSAFLQQNYASAWAVLPNIGLDIIGTMLLRVVPEPFAAHCVIILVMAVQFGGLLAFNRALTGRTAPLVAVLVVPLLYSWILNWGFANFLLGLGFGFAAAAWWVARRAAPLRALPVAVVAAAAIFFTHGVAFLLYGVLIASLELGFFLAGRERSWRDLAFRLGLCLVQAIVPVALFLHSKTAAVAGGLTNADESVARLVRTGSLIDRLTTLGLYRLQTIVRVAEGPTYAFDAVVLAAMAVLVGLLVRRGALRIVPQLWPTLVIALLLVLFCPPALFGVGYVADRMPLFAAMLLVGGLAVRIENFGDRNLAFGIAALVAVRLAAITVSWQGYAAELAVFDGLARQLPAGSLVRGVPVNGGPHVDADRRCAMYTPLLLTRHGDVTPLFADAAQQPLRLTGRLAATMARYDMAVPKAQQPDVAAIAKIGALGAAGFDYVLLCNANPALPLPVVPGMKRIAAAGRFAVLQPE